VFPPKSRKCSGENADEPHSIFQRDLRDFVLLLPSTGKREAIAKRIVVARIRAPINF
jgi:hypothetical protein